MTTTMTMMATKRRRKQRRRRRATHPLAVLCVEALGLAPHLQLESGVVQKFLHVLSPNHHCVLGALTVRVHQGPFLKKKEGN
jgi:hypothetical protein